MEAYASEAGIVTGGEDCEGGLAGIPAERRLFCGSTVWIVIERDGKCKYGAGDEERERFCAKSNKQVVYGRGM